MYPNKQRSDHGFGFLIGEPVDWRDRLGNLYRGIVAQRHRNGYITCVYRKDHPRIRPENRDVPLRYVKIPVDALKKVDAK